MCMKSREEKDAINGKVGEVEVTAAVQRGDDVDVGYDSEGGKFTLLCCMFVRCQGVVMARD